MQGMILAKGSTQDGRFGRFHLLKIGIIGTEIGGFIFAQLLPNGDKSQLSVCENGSREKSNAFSQQPSEVDDVIILLHSSNPVHVGEDDEDIGDFGKNDGQQR